MKPFLSDNLWDFRKYDADNWTLPRFTSGSHGGALPALAFAVASVLDEWHGRPGHGSGQDDKKLMGGIMMNKVVVYLVQNYSYTPWFVIAACLHPVALAIVWQLRKKTANP